MTGSNFKTDQVSRCLHFQYCLFQSHFTYMIFLRKDMNKRKKLPVILLIGMPILFTAIFFGAEMYFPHL